MQLPEVFHFSTHLSLCLKPLCFPTNKLEFQVTRDDILKDSSLTLKQVLLYKDCNTLTAVHFFFDDHFMSYLCDYLLRNVASKVSWNPAAVGTLGINTRSYVKSCFLQEIAQSCFACSQTYGVEKIEANLILKKLESCQCTVMQFNETDEQISQAFVLGWY